jgi:hypothetical protein
MKNNLIYAEMVKVLQYHLRYHMKKEKGKIMGVGLCTQ